MLRNHLVKLINEAIDGGYATSFLTEEFPKFLSPSESLNEIYPKVIEHLLIRKAENKEFIQGNLNMASLNRNEAFANAFGDDYRYKSFLKSEDYQNECNFLDTIIELLEKKVTELEKKVTEKKEVKAIKHRVHKAFFWNPAKMTQLRRFYLELRGKGFIICERDTFISGFNGERLGRAIKWNGGLPLLMHLINSLQEAGYIERPEKNLYDGYRLFGYTNEATLYAKNSHRKHNGVSEEIENKTSELLKSLNE